MLVVWGADLWCDRRLQRKSAEAFGDVKNERAMPVSTPAPTTTSPMSAVSAALHHTTTNGNTAALNAAAAAAAAAREKVMKEPQSGDLYECVITKRNGGLGLTLACVDDHVQITGLAPDTPAANSGICVGDTLVAVSGLPVRGLQFSTVIGRLKSTSRNSVVLKLRRNPCKWLDFDHSWRYGAITTFVPVRHELTACYVFTLSSSPTKLWKHSILSRAQAACARLG